VTKLTGWIISLILLAYSVACVMAIIYFSETVSVVSVTNLKKEGGVIGPIEVKKENTVYIVRATQPVGLGAWSAIDIGVYDENDQYLFSFNSDMWHESGYDEGYWEEDESTFDIAINFNKPGKYTLDVSVESSDATKVNDLVISVEERRGSALMFYWMAVMSFIAAFIVFRIKKVVKPPEPKGPDKTDKVDKVDKTTNEELQSDAAKKSS